MTHIGLCARCVYRREIVNGRGSVFTRCERSRIDERFARYPALPVLICPGFEETEPVAEDDLR